MERPSGTPSSKIVDPYPATTPSPYCYRRPVSTQTSVSAATESSAPEVAEESAKLDLELETLKKTLMRSGAKEDKQIPLVFVTGFGGWNAALFDTFNYWGGFQNLPQMLAKEGYAVIVVRIGPISSNWERACEVYAQLTAGSAPGVRGHGFDTSDPTTGHITTTGRVDIDYGQRYTHNEPSFPHGRFSKDRARAVLFGTTLDPDWEWSAEHPVHFICHSQGGTTVRLLLSFMTGGFKAFHEKYFTEARGDWTRSITTIGTPHQGTTIVDVLRIHSPDDWRVILARFLTSVSFIPAASTAVASTAAAATIPTRFYDLALDHRGIRARPGESYTDMYRRIVKDDGPLDLWLRSKLHGFWDNSIEGVAALTTFTALHPALDTFHFSMSFAATTPPPIITLTAADITSFPLPISPALAGLANHLTEAGARLMATFASHAFVGHSHDFFVWGTRIANRLLRDSVGGPFPIPIPAPGSQVPRGDMLPLLMPTGFGMGGYTLSDAQAALLGVNPLVASELEAWQVNDGVVNTKSMAGPVGATIEAIGKFSATRSQDNEEIWYAFETVTMDHADQIGAFTRDATSFVTAGMYKDIAAVLSYL